MKAVLNHHTGMSLNFPRSLRIIPPPQLGQNLIGTMEVTMQSLVLDTRHPIALELAGSGNKSSFIVRATTQAALDHVEALLRAEYPQIVIQFLGDDDPFRLGSDEAVSVVELIPEEDDTLSSYEQRSAAELKEGRDPLLGLLTVLGQLPNRVRAIVQIGLVPVSGSMMPGKLSNSKILGKTGDLGKTGLLGKAGIWDSRAIVGLRSTALAFFSSPRDIAVVAMINAIVLMLFSFLAGPWLPSWVWDDVWSFVLWGQFTVLTDQQVQQFIWCGIAFILVEGLFLFGTVKVMRRLGFEVSGQAPIINFASAYRTRILFYVIGPKSADEQKTSLSFLFPHIPSSGEKIREEVLLRIMATFRQFHAISGIAFVSKQVSSKNAHLLLGPDGWHQGLLQSNHLVSFRVLAALWHLPQYRTTITLKMLQERTTNVLPMLSAGPETFGVVTSPVPVGYAEHAGSCRPFSLLSSFFSYHTLIAGKSGEGKYAFMRHLGYAAMVRGGLVLIDPNGELCEDALKMVPLDRVEHVVFIDLADSTFHVGLNPLDVMLGYGRERIVSKLLKMLACIGVSGWGAKTEILFKMSLCTLFEANKQLVLRDPLNGPKQQYTLLDISPLLTNASFCHVVLQFVQDDGFHRWWREYYEPLSFALQRDVINPVMTRVAKFENMGARRIVGQGASTLNLAQMIAERKIILLKLAKGVVGGDVASLVGMIMLGLIELSLEVESWGRPIGLPIIIDEYDMLLGTDHRVLAQLHKYGATFFLAAQSLAYIQKAHPRLHATVQANVKQLVAFHMLAQDAEMLRKELGVEHDALMQLDELSCYIAMVAGEHRQPSFALKVASSPREDGIVAESIRTRCRVHYTSAVDEVDEMVRDAMLRRIGQLHASLPKERENRSGEGNLATSLHPLISPYVSDQEMRLMVSDTQPLPFIRELDTGELEILPREEYGVRASYRRGKECRGTPQSGEFEALSGTHNSADSREFTEKLDLIEAYDEDKQSDIRNSDSSKQQINKSTI